MQLNFKRKHSCAAVLSLLVSAMLLTSGNSHAQGRTISGQTITGVATGWGIYAMTAADSPVVEGCGGHRFVIDAAILCCAK